MKSNTLISMRYESTNVYRVMRPFSSVHMWNHPLFPCMAVFVLLSVFGCDMRQKQERPRELSPSLRVRYSPNAIDIGIGAHELAPLVEENIYFRVPVSTDEPKMISAALAAFPKSVKEAHLYRYRPSAPLSDADMRVSGPFRVYRQSNGQAGIHYSHLNELLRPGTDFIVSLSNENGRVLWPEDAGFRVEMGDVLLLVLTSVKPDPMPGPRNEIRVSVRMESPQVRPHETVSFWHTTDPFELPASQGDVASAATAGGTWVASEDGQLLALSGYGHSLMTQFEAYLVTDNDQLEQLVSVKGRQIEPIWLHPARKVRGGDTLIYRCGYANPHTETVPSGHAWHHEQCSLTGWWLPKTTERAQD